MAEIIGILHEELEALRRARDQSATQIQTAKNALDAAILTLADITTRIARIEICIKQIEPKVLEKP